jgi:hypothetical protein
MFIFALFPADVYLQNAMFICKMRCLLHPNFVNTELPSRTNKSQVTLNICFLGFYLVLL